MCRPDWYPYNAKEAQQAVVGVISAISAFQPVVVLVKPSQVNSCFWQFEWLCARLDCRLRVCAVASQHRPVTNQQMQPVLVLEGGER